jgi:hypothetical protein
MAPATKDLSSRPCCPAVTLRLPFALVPYPARDEDDNGVKMEGRRGRGKEDSGAKGVHRERCSSQPLRALWWHDGCPESSTLYAVPWWPYRLTRPIPDRMSGEVDEILVEDLGKSYRPALKLDSDKPAQAHREPLRDRRLIGPAHVSHPRTFPSDE